MSEEIRLRDTEAENLLQSVFPNGKVIMPDCLAVNLGGGGVHYISMQQPSFVQ